MIRLDDTSGGEVSAAIAQERHRMGSPTTGMVLTLLILADETTQADATAAAVAAARMHPMRIVTLIGRPRDRMTRLDAEISVGGDEGPGEVAQLRLRGALAEHANSVAIPLLLPDTPVVAYWPGSAPSIPADDPIGRHAIRRITDAAATDDPASALSISRVGYRPGDTDLAWARLTPWRSLLAAVFDAPIGKVSEGVVRGGRDDPSVALFASWLRLALKSSIEVEPTDVVGIASVELRTRRGPIGIDRSAGQEAVLRRPEAPNAQVSIPDPDLADLLGEELRRLDPDEVYQEALMGIGEPKTIGQMTRREQP